MFRKPRPETLERIGRELREKRAQRLKERVRRLATKHTEDPSGIWGELLAEALELDR